MILNRNQKTQEEIKKIIKACELGDRAFKYILDELKIGITEKQAVRLIKNFMKDKGAEISFRPIVSFGENASEVHHKPTDLKLRINHGFVMIDLGAKLNGYCSDMTRTVFMGKPSQEQRKIYQTVLAAQKKSVEYIEKQLSVKSDKLFAKEVDKAARDYIISKKFPAIPHSVGHGIGKKVHEGFRVGPNSRTILREQMVFSIEPGIYLQNLGGVRIEDLYLLKKDSLEKLTLSPTEIIVL